MPPTLESSSGSCASSADAPAVADANEALDVGADTPARGWFGLVACEQPTSENAARTMATAATTGTELLGRMGISPGWTYQLSLTGGAPRQNQYAPYRIVSSKVYVRATLVGRGGG